MDLSTLAHVPTALLVGVIASVVIPALSAALVRLHWDASITGALTLLLSTATGFFTEWGHAGDSFDWKTAAVAAAGSWVIAALAQSKILAGTALEAWLLTLGSKTPTGEGEPDPTDTLDDLPPAASVPGAEPAVDPAASVTPA